MMDRFRSLRADELSQAVAAIANKGKQPQGRRGTVYWYNGDYTWQVILDGEVFALPDCRRQNTTDFWHEGDVVMVQRIGKLDIITGFADGG